MVSTTSLGRAALRAGGGFGRMLLMLAVCVVFLAEGASAAIIDLTTAGADGSPTAAIGGTFLVEQISPQSTGTGVFDPFVRIQENDNEEGYNTDLAAQLDTKAGTWTHSLLLADVPLVTVDGVEYRQFVLDINEDGAAPKPLSLNQVQIFQAAADQLHTGLTAATATTPPVIAFAGTTEIFRMNNATAGFTEILLAASLNSGSGSGDMFLYVRDAAFTGTGDYVIFYSQFGTPPGTEDSGDGFEEWAVLESPGEDPVDPAPEPATLLLFGAALTFGIRARRNRTAG